MFTILRQIARKPLILCLLASCCVHARDMGRRSASVWETLEWKYSNVTFSGNPFDAEASVSFIHDQTGRKRVTEMFYDGQTWRFRFTGTLAGTWNFVSQSRIASLNGHTGSVAVGPRKEGTGGFLTHKGNRFAVAHENEDDLHGYVFTAYMGRVEHPAFLDEFSRDPGKTAELARQYYRDAQANGFEIVFIHVNNNWLKFGTREHNKHDSVNPDPAAFDVLETIIRTVRGLGGRVHIWAWGDESRRWTPRGLPGGINGPADRRLQRYIAARLGPLCGWTMGYGFDLHEWTNAEQLNDWARYLHSHMGWQHLLCARGHRLDGPHNMNSYDGFGRNVELATTAHGPRGYDEIVEDLRSGTGRPHLYEERHSYKRSGFDLDMDGTRRLLWAETMAGGMGGFFGFYSDSPHPYPEPEQLRTHYTFWHEKDRFLLDMQRANAMAEPGHALLSSAAQSAVLYCENTESVAMDLSALSQRQPAIAVDTKKECKEIALGELSPGRHTWEAPYRSDWALAVGRFADAAQRPKSPSPPPANAKARNRIVVNPKNPRWLMRGDGRPLFMCGPGDPEGFLYRGKLKPDGTRDGDQMELISKLAGTGANCIYLMAVRSHGGDGGRTENPFIDHDPARGLNTALLDQWRHWFDAMERAGIVIYFFLYDDSVRLWPRGDNVSSQEEQFLRALVDRFEGYGSLIWCIAEEYGESLSARRVSNIAAVIRSADDYDHAIAVHKNHGLSFDEFADDRNIDQFAIQYNVDTAEKLHAGMVKAWNDAAGRYSLNMSEAAGFGTGAELRRKCWACAMGGAYVMILEMDIANTPLEDLQACGHLVRFFESTSFETMAPHDELAYGGTEYVLADPGRSYIAYTSNSKGDLGLKNMRPGSYDLRWLDCTTGKRVDQRDVRIEEGNRSWSRPKGIGSETALYMRRR